MRVAVIDYGAGNLFSLMSALTHLRHDPVLVGDRSEFHPGFDVVVLPGVGAFGTGMMQLAQRGLVRPLQDFAAAGQRLVGICLGAQLLLESSEEFGHTEGLGIVAGTVRSLRTYGVATPVVGWSPVVWSHVNSDGWTGQWMYFVHSYAMMPNDDDLVVARTERNGFAYAAAIGKGSVLGLQFHPEKSGTTGVDFLGSILRQETSDE